MGAPPPGLGLHGSLHGPRAGAQPAGGPAEGCGRLLPAHRAPHVLPHHERRGGRGGLPELGRCLPRHRVREQGEASVWRPACQSSGLLSQGVGACAEGGGDEEAGGRQQRMAGGNRPPPEAQGRHPAAPPRLCAHGAPPVCRHRAARHHQRGGRPALCADAVCRVAQCGHLTGYGVRRPTPRCWPRSTACRASARRRCRSRPASARAWWPSSASAWAGLPWRPSSRACRSVVRWSWCPEQRALHLAFTPMLCCRCSRARRRACGRRSSR